MLYPNKFVKVVTPLALAIALASCGGASSFGEGGGGATDGGSGGGGKVVQSEKVASIDLQATSLQLLSDGTAPIDITAIAKNEFNNAISEAVLQFSVDKNATLVVEGNKATLTPNGSAVGFLTVTVTSGEVSKTIQIEVITAITQSESDIKLGASDGDSFQVGKLEILDESLKAGGKTSIKVSLVNSKNGNELVTDPATITFNSSCIANGLAKVSEVAFSSGVATVEYEAKGCSGVDTVTATAIVDGKAIRASSDINIEAAVVGSLSFEEAVPANIGLKGMGLNEVSTVTFTALDIEGNPVINQNVIFSLSTEIGGITLTSTTAKTDSNGKVSAKVHAGTKASTVKVKAKIVIDGKEIKTESRGLVISTGIADQNSFSLSVGSFNPEALNYDGVTTNLNVQAADHFNNPVPEGTAIYFTAEAGTIAPLCLTDANGSCSVDWRSGGDRPDDGRVTILASMQGEESFVDTNGNGLLDDSESFTDLPEVFRDDNKDGIHNGTDELNDYNENGQFDAANGEYNGLLCNPANTVNKCSEEKNVYVSDDIEIVMSGSTAKINSPAVVEINEDSSQAFQIELSDENDQPLPAGTKVEVSIANIGKQGETPYKIVSELAWEIPNTNAAGPMPYTIIVQDGTGKSSILKIKVTTPKNVVTYAYVNLIQAGTQQEPNLAASMDLSTSSSQILQNGTKPVTINAIVKDDNNNVLSDIPVLFSVDKGTLSVAGNTAVLTPASDAAVGDQMIVTATIFKSNGPDLVKTIVVDVVETLDDDQNPSQAHSLEFTASTRQLFSSGSEPVVLSAIVKDVNNNTVSNETVIFSVNNEATITLIDTDGVVKTANLTPGSKENRSLNVTAMVGDIQKTIQVDVVGTSLTVEGPASIAINKPSEYIFKLRDSDDKVIPFTDVSLTSTLGVVTPALAKTNANGELIVNLESTTGGAAVISATAIGAQASKDITISSNDFTLTGTDLNGDGSIDLNDTELALGATETITLKWLEGVNPQVGETISVRSTRGTLNVATVTTNAAGEATFTVTSNTAGSATITAETASGLTAILEREFVAITPRYLNTQASPSLISPNKNSTIITKVRDINDNPVKNIKVNFNLTDTVNGTLSNSQAVTDSLGRAEVVYTAGDDSSAFEAVRINTYLQDFTTITDDISLTVGGKALRISLGEDEELADIGVFYKKQFAVLITDSAGNPIEGQTVNFTIIPIGYKKGNMYLVDTDADGKADRWDQYVSAYCPTEDLDNDGNLDVGEDDNGNGVLDPTHDASVTVVGVTDENGKLYVDVVYPQNKALWSSQRITARTLVNGTEFFEHIEFSLPITAADVSDPEGGVPNQFSPYGVSTSCSDNSGIVTDDIIFNVVDAVTGLAVSFLEHDVWYTVNFLGAHGQAIPSGSTYTVSSSDANVTVETGPNNSFKLTDGSLLLDDSGFSITLDTVTADGSKSTPLYYRDIVETP